MKKIGFLGLILLTLLVFAAVWISKSEGATTAVTAKVLTKDQLTGMIRPTLEQYVTNHPDPQVRIWSMVILANIDKIVEQQLSSIPLLVRQLGNKDENIRQIALNSIRKSLTLEDKDWKAIMGTVFRAIAKNSKYPEAKKLAIKSLGVLQDLEVESLDSLSLLFDLAQDDDPDIRQVANQAITDLLAKENSGQVGGGPVGPR